MDGTAVGFMSLSTSVNVDLLKSGFQLEVFSNLKTKVLKPPEPEPEPEKEGKIRYLKKIVLLVFNSC